MKTIVFEIAFSGIENRFRASARSVNLVVEAPSLREIEAKIVDRVRSYYAGQTETPKHIVVRLSGQELMRLALA